MAQDETNKMKFSIAEQIADAARTVHPIPSIYGIFTCIDQTNQPNVDKYAIHGWYGSESLTSTVVSSES